jgi:pimeloyl-ACP methyl ester carboxylesterase
MPGLTCDGHIWDATVAHFGGKIQAHVMTLAGFSGKPPIDKPLLPTVHDELVRYIGDNHLERPIFVGHSIGGFMAYWLAESAPDLLAGGVAVDGGPFLPALIDPKATVASSAPMATMLQQRMSDPAQFQQGVRGYMASMLREPAKYQDLIDTFAKSDPKTTADTMYFVTQTDLRPDLAKITSPILVIAADVDGQMPRAAVEAAWHAQVDAIPSHELVVVDHSKHFIMLDQPEALYAALDAFLAKH